MIGRTLTPGIAGGKYKFAEPKAFYRFYYQDYDLNVLPKPTAHFVIPFLTATTNKPMGIDELKEILKVTNPSKFERILSPLECVEIVGVDWQPINEFAHVGGTGRWFGERQKPIMPSLTFEQAVETVSRFIDRSDNFTVFDGSTALAVVFSMPKEKTMDAIVAYRQKVYLNKIRREIQPGQASPL